MIRSCKYLVQSVVKFKVNISQHHVRSVLYNDICSKPVARFLSQSLLCRSTGTPSLDSSSAKDKLEFNMEEITNGDPELIKRQKMIELEIEVLRQEGSLVPDNIKPKEWKELIILPSRSQRARYLVFLFKNQMADENKKLKKQAKKEAVALLDKSNENPSGHIQYGLQHNTIFFRIYETKMDHQLNSKLIHAMQFSQDLVIDCSYEAHMTRREIANCAKQLCLLFSDNRLHVEPYNIQFCNLNPSGLLKEKLYNYIPTCNDPSFPINLTSKSYLELYPKDQLVYLTPHCKDVLHNYSHDDVYIVGAMVDKVNNEPLSLAKAKEQGLRVAKLPLDHYLDWGSGSKNLTINSVINIMLDVRKSNDWNFALKHIPRRKLQQETDLLRNPNYVKKQGIMSKQFTGPFVKKKINFQTLFNK